MAVKIETPLKEGYLLVPPQGVIGLKKKWQKRFCQLFSPSICGIERLEIYENEEDASRNVSVPIITLENCVKISQDTQKNQPHSFSVVTKTSIHHFAALSEEDFLDWFCAFQRVAFPDTISRRTVEEDNELYSHSSDGVYRVTVASTEASQRCGLSPGVEYILVVAASELQLRRPETQEILFTWPYRFIRRYGHASKRGRFTFEAGRKCESGEGIFDFEHAHAQEIFRCTTNKMESMKQMLSIRMDSATGGLLLGDFAPALSMSARSRSPLAPTPTGSTIIVPSIVPAKPPRKNPPPPKLPQYDHIEVRREAWRTLGTDDLPHTERTFPRTGVFTQDSTSSQGDYDKLDHFGSTAKTELEPGYSTILRQASDSSSGYGVIRKLKTPNHTVYNDMEYAVVCKPHRV